MCTLTIHREASRVLATMNRDEALVRGPERLPEVHRPAGGPAWIAPHDTDKGGTWMGVNDQGLVACLLNAYMPGESLLPDPTANFRSRGEIIPQLLQKDSIDAGLHWLLHELDLSQYPSFTLVLSCPEWSKSFQWLRARGMKEIPIDTEWYLLSSSGWDSVEVIAWRLENFESWRASGADHVDTLPRFHLIQEEGAEDRSPLMKRDWSETRSITQALVDPELGRAELRYWAKPTRDSKAPDTTLDLRLGEDVGVR